MTTFLWICVIIFCQTIVCHNNYVSSYRDFIPNDATQTCHNDSHATPFDKQVRGVNLGGWLILEPWLTPSMFYQFLSAQQRFGDEAPKKTGMDMYTFCQALGPVEGNRQLRLHWKKWVTEDIIRKLASYGLNSLRIPVGDWMFIPNGYGPYTGCTDGAVDELTRVLDLAQKYGLDVLIDIHAHKGSQNGFDNSGMAHTVKWTSLASSLPIGTTTFEHWPIRVAEWVGEFNSVAKNYTSINFANIQQSLDVMLAITEMYKDHPAVLGIQPINEPWELTPIDVLKEFYWKGYLQTKGLAPNWKYFLHDSFRFGVQFWGGFMKGCPDIAMDTHIYQAWNNPGSSADFFANACQQKFTISTMEDAAMPVVVGEWSLATDNCAMWINGFNDNLPGFPKVQCDYIPCGDKESYLGSEFSGIKLDRTKPIQGPYGTGTSGPSFGQCPVSNSKRFEDLGDEAFFRQLAKKKLNAFTVGHGFYFWNFRTELDIKWDFMRLVENGWLVLNDSSKIEDACIKEDNGEFVCAAKRGGVPEDTLIKNFNFACKNLEGITCDSIVQTFPDLLDRCDYAFNLYWQKNRVFGATCDFGGSASLRSPRAPPTNLSPVVLDTVATTGLSLSSFDSNATVTVKLTTIVGLVGFVLSISGLILGFVLKSHRQSSRYIAII